MRGWASTPLSQRDYPLRRSLSEVEVGFESMLASTPLSQRDYPLRRSLSEVEVWFESMLAATASAILMPSTPADKIPPA
jgi:hypothetical protein